MSCTTRFVHASFADGLRGLLAEGIRADLVYVDLGISSMQVDTWERGFSYSYDAPLDMRMDTEQELDARTVLNTWEVRRIAQLLREYGDERYASPDRPRDRRACVRSRRSRRPASSSTSSTTRSP